MLIDGIIEGGSKAFELDENIAIRACDWCSSTVLSGPKQPPVLLRGMIGPH